LFGLYARPSNTPVQGKKNAAVAAERACAALAPALFSCKKKPGPKSCTNLQLDRLPAPKLCHCSAALIKPPSRARGATGSTY